MIVWRVLPVDPAAATDAAGGPLWFPARAPGRRPARQPRRLRLPVRGADAGVGRRRGAVALPRARRADRGDARARRPAAVARRPGPARAPRPARPRRARDAGRRGAATLRRGHPRARHDPARRPAPLSEPSPRRPACAGGRRSRRRGSTSRSSIARAGGCACAPSSCWAPSTRPCAARPPSWGSHDRRRRDPRPPRPHAVRRGAHQLLPGRRRPAHPGRRRAQLGDLADRARCSAGRARAAHRGPRADRHHPPAHRPHRAGRRSWPTARAPRSARSRAGAVAGAATPR